MISIESIQREWKAQISNQSAETAVWDAAASNFRTKKIPDEKTDEVLRIMVENKMCDGNSRVLDVGCGAGRYSFALANLCREVVGTDLSGQMIAAAEEDAGAMGFDNVSFIRENWRSLDPEKLGWKNAFDLVFANMTPAVVSADTFQKLIDCSRNWCLMSKPVHRNNFLINETVSYLGIDRFFRSAAVDMLYAFDYLFLKGLTPMITYRKETRENNRPVERAEEDTIRRIEEIYPLGPDQKKKIHRFILNKAQDGIIKNRVESTIAILYWQV